MSDFDYLDELDASVDNEETDGENGRTTYAHDPYTHRCGVKDVPFPKGTPDRVRCNGCGATWVRGSQGWQRHPNPSRNRDFRKKTR